MGNFAENLNLGNRVRPPLDVDGFQDFSGKILRDKGLDLDPVWDPVLIN